MNCATHHMQKHARLIKLVHIAANELGLLDPKRHATDTDDEYHLLLHRWNRQGTRQPVTSSLQMTTAQLDELLVFFMGLGFKVRGSVDASKRGSEASASTPPRIDASTPRSYPSSIAGLKEEVTDMAKARWGDSWETSLNSFCLRFGVKRWQWLDVAHGKAVKVAMMRISVDESKRESNPAASTHSPIDASTDPEVPF